MHLYQEAVRQYREMGYVSDEIRNSLPADVLVRAYEEANR